MRVNRKKVALFVLLTYALSLLLAGGYFLMGGTTQLPRILVLGVAYMYIPAIVAMFIQKIVYKAPLIGPLRISFKLNRWFLLALLLPLVVSVLTFGVSLLFPGVTFSSHGGDFGNLFIEPQQVGLPRSFWAGLVLGLLQGVVTGVTVNAVAAFGEELGWRGLLQSELAPMGFWRSSWLVGLVWGVWHAPLIVRGIDYPTHPRTGILLMTMLTLLLAPVFGYIALRANSVIAAAVIHGTFNGASVVATVGLKGGNDLIVGVGGLSGLLVLLITNVALFFYDARSKRLQNGQSGSQSSENFTVVSTSA